MKKLLIILIATIFLSFKTFEEKKYSISMTQPETVYMATTLDVCRQAVLKSKIPMDEGVQILSMIDSVQRLLSNRLYSQLPKPEKK